MKYYDLVKISSLLSVFILLGQVQLPAVAAQSKPAPTTATPIRDYSPISTPIINFQGKFDSIPQPDGSYILTFTGGIIIHQRIPEENTILELHAQNAVIFSRQNILDKIDTSPAGDPNQVGDSSLLHQIARFIEGIYLENDVTLHIDHYKFARNVKITADRIYYDFTRHQALITKGVMEMQIPESSQTLYFRAQSIYQSYLYRYSIEEAQFSLDEFDLPHVWLGVKKIDIFPAPGKKAPARETDSADQADAEKIYHYSMKNITAHLGEMPFFWWPAAAGKSTKPEIPIKTFRTNYNSEYGMGVETQWDLAWLLGLHEPEGVESSLRLDEFSKRGPAGGVDVEYSRENYYGSLRSYLLHDSGEDRLGNLASRKDIQPTHKTRGRASWRHRQYLPYDWQMSLEINYFSDPDFLESWEEKEFDIEKEKETLVYLKQQRENWAFDFLNKFHLNDFDSTLTELPAAGVHLAGQDLFETFTYHYNGYVSRYRERAGDREVPGFFDEYEPSILPDSLDQDDFAFALSRHELSLPLHLGPFNFAPTVIGTFVLDESQFDESLIDDPRYEENRSEDCFVQGAAGLRTSTRLWRVDNTVQSRLFDLDRIRHIIIPQASTFWIDSDLPEAQRHDIFNFALRQRWQTLRGPEGQKHSIDFLRLDTSATLVTHDVDDAPLPSRFLFSNPETQYDPTAIANSDLINLGQTRREQRNQNLSDHADARLTWLISDTTVFNTNMNYNIHDGVISQAGAGFAIQRSPRTRYYISDRYLHNGDPFRNQNAHFFTGGVSYKLNRKYTLALSQQYDIEQTAASHSRATIIRKFPHWFGAFSMSYHPNRDSVSVMITFWPEGFDNFVLGSRRFTRLAP